MAEHLLGLMSNLYCGFVTVTICEPNMIKQRLMFNHTHKCKLSEDGFIHITNEYVEYKFHDKCIYSVDYETDFKYG